jgi:hypothetical protein
LIIIFSEEKKVVIFSFFKFVNYQPKSCFFVIVRRIVMFSDGVVGTQHHKNAALNTCTIIRSALFLSSPSMCSSLINNFFQQAFLNCKKKEGRGGKRREEEGRGRKRREEEGRGEKRREEKRREGKRRKEGRERGRDDTEPLLIIGPINIRMSHF